MSRSGPRFNPGPARYRVQVGYDRHGDDTGSRDYTVPFVVGVLADLAGKAPVPPTPVGDRKFLEIDADNFNDRLKAIAPHLVLQVPNALSDDGTQLTVDVRFESMDDFDPAALVRNVEPLRKLVQARAQLKDLLERIDGNPAAADLVGKLLADPSLLQSLAASAKPPAK